MIGYCNTVCSVVDSFASKISTQEPDSEPHNLNTVVIFYKLPFTSSKLNQDVKFI